jgi:DUF4097 and DUF4098 domain-containing protein YvlB
MHHRNLATPEFATPKFVSPRFVGWAGAVLGTLSALLLAGQAQASEHPGSLTEEFHHTYPISADGRVELDNINGAVRITGWDRNEVKVDAVKYADSKDQLDDAQIQVSAGSNYVSIHTEYHSHNHYFGTHHDSASVEYALTVPRGARLDEIKLINGPLNIEGVGGEVRASCVNAEMIVEGLRGRAELSSVNGRMEVRFDGLSNAPVELSSVNGSLEVVLPSDAKAEIEASTVSGRIENDFGLHVDGHRFVGHSLDGELGGGGGARIKLSNVNGRIEIRHANDGKPLSPAKDRGHRDDDDDEI